MRVNVRDLAASIDWYEHLLGVAAHGHWPPDQADTPDWEDPLRQNGTATELTDRYPSAASWAAALSDRPDRPIIRLRRTP